MSPEKKTTKMGPELYIYIYIYIPYIYKRSEPNIVNRYRK